MNHLLNTYNFINIEFSHGKGTYLYDTNGKKYLDFAAGIAVNSLGHSHPEIIKTITNQSKKFLHAGNIYKSTPRNNLAKTLCNASFGDKVFFSNSGAEAIEALIKIIRMYNKEKNEIITFKGGFHGRTITTISAIAKPLSIENFSPLTKGFKQAEFNNIQSVKNLITNKTAAILIEPIQGAGGVRKAEKNFMKDLRNICDKKNIILALDEVQTGVGRTGKLWCYENFDIEPDIMALAKGLAGGIPIGATIIKEKIAKNVTPGTHGSTFGGNVFAMSIANTVINIIKDKEFLKNITMISKYLKKELEKISPNIHSIKGLGYMIGFKLENIKSPIFVKKLRENGLLSVATENNTIRLVPPLIIKKEDVDKAIKIITKTINQ